METRRPVDDVREGDEILDPRSRTWRAVHSVAVAEECGLVRVTFSDGDRLAFCEGTVVAVRRGSTSAAQPAPVVVVPAPPPMPAPPLAPVAFAPAPLATLSPAPSPAPPVFVPAPLPMLALAPSPVPPAFVPAPLPMLAPAPPVAPPAFVPAPLPMPAPAPPVASAAFVPAPLPMLALAPPVFLPAPLPMPASAPPVAPSPAFVRAPLATLYTPPPVSRAAAVIVQAWASEGEIIVETRVLVTDYQTTHAVEVDARGTALRVLCGAVPLEDIGPVRYTVPTCLQCVRIDALPVRCPTSSPRWLALELRRAVAERWKVWHDAKEKAERDAEARRAEAAAKWRQAQHVSLSAPERAWAEALRRDWAEHGEEPEHEELIHYAPGDCGKRHLSFAAACACANVRRENEERRAREARGARPPLPAPRPPTPATSSSAPRQPTPAPRPPPTPPTTISAPTPAPSTATSLATPSPQASSPPVDYTARILAAVARTPLRSARAIFQETGGNKLAVFETVKRMVREGRLVTNSEGTYQVGDCTRARS